MYYSSNFNILVLTIIVSIIDQNLYSGYMLTLINTIPLELYMKNILTIIIALSLLSSASLFSSGSGEKQVTTYSGTEGR
jgi:hypothetical protein